MRNTRTSNLYSTRHFTGNQWRCFNTAIMLRWSPRLIRSTTLAAKCWTMSRRWVRDPVKDCVPVINTRCHEGMDEGFAGCSVQPFAYLGNTKQVKIGASASIRHLSRHVKSIVKNNADVTNGRQQRYSSPANVNSALNRS